MKQQHHPSAPFALTIKDSQRMLFVTGIPRSGTSLMAHLLAQLPDIAILNEPLEIPYLFADRSLDAFFATYMIWRTKIAKGEGVENQCVDDRVVCDTWNNGNRRLYLPKINRADFVLGTKNPLIYLTRLKTIRMAFPGAMIVILVRHPYFTIGSWKRTFPHLKNATIYDSTVFKFADAYQRERLLKIAKIEDSATRRAGLWNYLANEIITCADPNTIIRYEDLVDNPFPYLYRIHQRFFGDTNLRVNQSLKTHNDKTRYSISIEEQKCIASVCASTAAWLGYYDL